MKILRFLLLFLSLSMPFLALLRADYCLSQKIRENILSSGRADVLAVWEDLEASGGGLEWPHPTPAQRELCVRLQACIERALVSGMSEQQLLAAGVIHTPLPATPLRTCVEQGAAPEALALSRPKILRDFLSAEACLVAAYSKKCLQSPPSGMDCFQLLQCLYPNLSNSPCFDAFHDDWTGASYLICKFSDANQLFFSIKARQAQNVTEGMQLGIWFGPLSAPKVAERYDYVNSFLKPAGVDLPLLLWNQLSW